MNPLGISTRPLIDPKFLAEYNRGVERAVRANRPRMEYDRQIDKGWR